MYRCARCNEPMRDYSSSNLQCQKCGYKIFFKDRPEGRKITLKSD